jgi:rhodanese-related sulfurtransferase
MKFNYHNMNIRGRFSAILLTMGVIVAILPLSGNLSFTLKPTTLLPEVLSPNTCFSVDQIAKLIVSEDSTIQIIDLRSPVEFRTMNIPGSINVPYKELLEKDPGLYIDPNKVYNVFYSNSDCYSNFALTIARGLNYKNTYVMSGGLNEWFKTIMNSSFEGVKISVKENAVFEARTRAANIFTTVNSLPDSMKIKFIRTKRLAAKKLDGGCE